MAREGKKGSPAPDGGTRRLFHVLLLALPILFLTWSLLLGFFFIKKSFSDLCFGITNPPRYLNSVETATKVELQT